MTEKKIAVSWFEIPASDLERAVAFYESIFTTRLNPMPGPEGEVRTFPNGDLPSGCVSKSSRNRPSKEGALLFLGAGGGVSEVAGRVERSGGKLVMPPTSIGEHGFIAQFIDTEGNRVALHGLQE